MLFVLGARIWRFELYANCKRDNMHKYKPISISKFILISQNGSQHFLMPIPVHQTGLVRYALKV